MLVELKFGAPRETAEQDAFGMLAGCHERIRRFSGLALTLPKITDPSELREVAGRVHRYFSVGMPHHVQDEELSLAPRLESSGAAAQVAKALAEMKRQHVDLDRRLEELLPGWQALSEGATVDLATLTGFAQTLSALFEEHLALEETEIVPVAKSALSASEKQSLFQEIRTRRGAQSSF